MEDTITQKRRMQQEEKAELICHFCYDRSQLVVRSCLGCGIGVCCLCGGLLPVSNHPTELKVFCAECYNEEFEKERQRRIDARAPLNANRMFSSRVTFSPRSNKRQKTH